MVHLNLATRISKHTPGNLNRIFYTICGSTAVETAIKIAVSLITKQEVKDKDLDLLEEKEAYHGMNIGATSVGGMINNVKTFAKCFDARCCSYETYTFSQNINLFQVNLKQVLEIAEDLERICTEFWF